MDAPVKRAPALLPALLDVRDDHLSEARADPLRSVVVRVRGKLELPTGLDLLEPRRRESEESSACDLRVGRGYTDGDPAEPRAHVRVLLR
jgi:hypothetical protein